MSPAAPPSGDDLWRHHDEQFRHPAEIAAQWQNAHAIDARLLDCTTHGQWWETLHKHQITLIVTREYEHLVLALSVDASGAPAVSFMSVPHPSGVAVDRARGVVHLASTRNPNQIFDLVPVDGLLPRRDLPGNARVEDKPLIPVRSRFLPGCLYLHDLALIGDELHANAVGQNAVIRLLADGHYERAWWPKCIETPAGPIFDQNHLQLNSIAAGDGIENSFFSASTDEVTGTRPGDPAFSVDRRGVVFSGASREVIARGLSRPHSARLHRARLWVDDSGYGGVGVIEQGKLATVARLPGWTRGLCFHEDVMFVGTSRVIPRFRQYAPGLDVDASLCGVHALDAGSGKLLGSLIWPTGNQVFAIETVPSVFTKGFPWHGPADATDARARSIFYAFRSTDTSR